MVIALGSHHLWGWPSVDSLPLSFHSSERHTDASSAAKEAAKDADDEDDKDDDSAKGDASAATANMKVFRVDGDRFILRPDPGTRISVVTSAGPLEMKNNDGKLKIDTVGGARDLFKVGADGTWSIASSDIVALDLKDEDGNRVSVARVGKDPKAIGMGRFQTTATTCRSSRMRKATARASLCTAARIRWKSTTTTSRFTTARTAC